MTQERQASSLDRLRRSLCGKALRDLTGGDAGRSEPGMLRWRMIPIMRIFDSHAQFPISQHWNAALRRFPREDMDFSFYSYGPRPAPGWQSSSLRQAPIHSAGSESCATWVSPRWHGINFSGQASFFITNRSS